MGIQIRLVDSYIGVTVPTTAYQLQQALDALPAMAAQLWKGQFKRVDIYTINRLGKLLRCKPNDLLKYESDLGD